MAIDRPYANEKGRLVSQTAFPVLRWRHISGRFQDRCTRGLSPGRVLLGCRCKSGQSRTVARTDAMVSHLRKMVLLGRDHVESTSTRRGCGHGCPRCSRCSQARRRFRTARSADLAPLRLAAYPEMTVIEAQ